jgi:hypothetical protein
MFAVELETRIRKRIKRYDPDDPRLARVLHGIGMLLESQIKTNIKKKKIISIGGGGGALLNSIGYNLFKRRSRVGVEVGSRGIPYAAMNEFGTKDFSPLQRRAMFATLRKSGRDMGPHMSKNIIRGNVFRARPYVRPAIKKHRKLILKKLREVVRDGNRS